MNNQPISVYYESKVIYLIFSAILVLISLFLLISAGGNYLNSVWFYVLCIFLISLLYTIFYPRSFFYIYEDKLVWKKGRHQITTPWSGVVAIHAHCLPKNPFKRIGSGYFLYHYLFLETQQGLTKQANELNIKRVGNSTFWSHNSKELICDIEKYSGKTMTNEMLVTLEKLSKDKTRFIFYIFIILVIVLITVGGLWYLNYQTQSEINSVPNVSITP